MSVIKIIGITLTFIGFLCVISIPFYIAWKDGEFSSKEKEGN